MLTNERGCNEGSIAHLVWAAKASFADALLLLPNNGSLTSFSSEVPNTTPVYDLYLKGHCTKAGRSYSTLEALVFASPGQIPTVVEEQQQGTAPATKPFGEQWNE